MAVEENGFDKVHHHVGREPSGEDSKGCVLKDRATEKWKNRQIPHNPLINAGAIMMHALLHRDPKTGKALQNSDRFNYVADTWRRLCGDTKVGFNNSVYLSEKNNANRNWCLGFMMSEYHSFPEQTHLENTLNFYFQSCSIEITCRQLGVVAATLANGGQCPLTDDRIFKAGNLRPCLSLMLSCGMNEASGAWAFEVGLPAKSGISGAVILVIPNKMGIALWSPRVDKDGNSVRGKQFCQELVTRYNFHHFDSLIGVVELGEKEDPTKKTDSKEMNPDQMVVALLFAAATGDLKSMQTLEAQSADLWAADYDNRTALHLAASEGRLNVVKFLVGAASNCTKAERIERLSPLDRWMRTPLDDAHSGCEGYRSGSPRKAFNDDGNHRKVVALLTGMGGKRGRGQDKEIPFHNALMHEQAREVGTGDGGRFMAAHHLRRKDSISRGGELLSPTGWSPMDRLENRRVSVLEMPEFSAAMLSSPDERSPPSPQERSLLSSKKFRPQQGRGQLHS